MQVRILIGGVALTRRERKRLRIGLDRPVLMSPIKNGLYREWTCQIAGDSAIRSIREEAAENQNGLVPNEF